MGDSWWRVSMRRQVECVGYSVISVSRFVSDSNTILSVSGAVRNLPLRKLRVAYSPRMTCSQFVCHWPIFDYI